MADLSSTNHSLRQQVSQLQTNTVDQHLQEKVALAKARGEIVALETRLSSMKEAEAVLMRERSELQAHIQRLDGQMKELHDQLVSVRYSGGSTGGQGGQAPP